MVQSSPARPVTLSLIGAGIISRAHAQAAARLPVEVRIQVTDPNPDARSSFASQFPDARVFDDLDAMLAGPAAPCDIVVIAAPPAFHALPAIAAMDSGRHVLCEKPLSLDREQAMRMYQAARQNNVLLGCCSCRFSGLPVTAEIRNLLNDGTLGKAYHMSFINRSQRARSGIEFQPNSRWFLDRRISGGGVLMDWGPYDIAALTELLEPVRVDILAAWCSMPRTGRDPDDIPLATEQHVGASFRMHRADGSVIAVTYERAACTHGEPRSVIELEADNGAVRWQWLGGKGQIVRTFDTGGAVQTEQTEFPDTSGLHPHDKPLVYFHRRIIGQDSPAIVNELALYNFSILRGIYDVAMSGCSQKVVLESIAAS